MEPNQPSQTQPVFQTQPTPVKPKRSKTWLLVLLLVLLAAGACYGVYYWQNQQLKDSQQALSAANAEVDSLNKKLKYVPLPGASDFSPQCESKDNSDLIVSALTPEPVENHQAYITNCKNSETTPARVTAFKINDDGSRTFVYGASTIEPLCLSSKIMDAAAAAKLSEAAKVPICTQF
jgi:hypothetical protein